MITDDDKLKSEEETMIVEVYRLYRVDDTKVGVGQGRKKARLPHHQDVPTTQITINKINTITYLRVLCRLSSA